MHRLRFGLDERNGMSCCARYSTIASCPCPLELDHIFPLLHERTALSSLRQRRVAMNGMSAIKNARHCTRDAARGDHHVIDGNRNRGVVAFTTMPSESPTSTTSVPAMSTS